jgi:hypothetical protein
MSEKIYSWLLRLYPSQFRDKYGEEALQLFLDRMRDEKGLFARTRLWLDLLVDLAMSLPGGYLQGQTEFAGYPAWYGASGVPTFYFLPSASPHRGALLFGTLLSSAALVTFSVLLGYAGSNGRTYALPGQSQGGGRFSEQDSGPADPGDAAARTNPAGRIDAAERRRVAESAASILKQHYVERENGENMANALLRHERNGDDDWATDGGDLAALLTRQMRELRSDRHLALVYSEAPWPVQVAVPVPEDLARYEKELQEENCTFEKVAVLPHHIGYVKLNSFPDVSACRKVAEDAMASLNSADAIIFDLRDNRGGDPAMVMLIAAYLFSHPEYMYNPRENTTEQCWTRSPVTGSSLADKPVYILTSRSTASAAEHFSYDLKMLKRATVVGERTAGAAHSGVWHRIDDHFGIAVPETKAINPFSTHDWAEVGVEPDVSVKAGDAPETAVRLARGRPPSR